jgi:hypothetical protein
LLGKVDLFALLDEVENEHEADTPEDCPDELNRTCWGLENGDLTDYISTGYYSFRMITDGLAFGYIESDGAVRKGFAEETISIETRRGTYSVTGTVIKDESFFVAHY